MVGRLNNGDNQILPKVGIIETNFSLNLSEDQSGGICKVPAGEAQKPEFSLRFAKLYLCLSNG